MTFSLIALDQNRRTLGVACATGGPALGGFVPHLVPGVGAAITQGYSTNVLTAEQGLSRLMDGAPVASVVEELRRADRGEAWRQLALMDITGTAAGWTGTRNVPVCDMHLAPGLVVAGNMLGSEEVIPTMVDAYREGRAAGLALEDALLAALVAGQQAGGDHRGTLSAALRVRAPGGLPLDLRIDQAADAVGELCTLLRRIREDDDFQAFLSRLPTADDPHRH